MKNCESGLIKYSRKKELPDSHACHTMISLTPYNGNRTATKYHIRDTTTELIAMNLLVNE